MTGWSGRGGLTVCVICTTSAPRQDIEERGLDAAGVADLPCLYAGRALVDALARYAHSIDDGMLLEGELECTSGGSSCGGGEEAQS